MGVTFKHGVFMPDTFPGVIHKSQCVQWERTVVMAWNGKNPDLPYNPRHLPIHEGIAVTMMLADKGDYVSAALWSTDNYYMEGVWFCHYVKGCTLT